MCGIIGSLRQGSYNRGLMMAAIELARDAGLDIRVFDRLAEIPIYNADDDTDEKRPEVVVALKQAIGDAAGLVIATPEYNYSIPGGLKNAFDWASRPAANSPLNRKPAAMMGASTGISGTIRAQIRGSISRRRIRWGGRREIRVPACAIYRLVHTKTTPHPLL